jgi:hypothetical protein
MVAGCECCDIDEGAMGRAKTGILEVFVVEGREMEVRENSSRMNQQPGLALSLALLALEDWKGNPESVHMRTYQHARRSLYP